MRNVTTATVQPKIAVIGYINDIVINELLLMSNSMGKGILIALETQLTVKILK